MRSILILAVFVMTLAILAGCSQTNYSGFASCLGEKNATFYGAFWCPHCQNQKALFGKAAGLLPYVECSTPDGRGQLPTCGTQGIQSYPTWIFSDGTRLTGEIPLQTLASKTGCELP